MGGDLGKRNDSRATHHKCKLIAGRGGDNSNVFRKLKAFISDGHPLFRGLRDKCGIEDHPQFLSGFIHKFGDQTMQKH